MAEQLSMESDFPEVSQNIYDKIQTSGVGFKSKFNEENVFDSMYKDWVTAFYTDAVDVKAAGRQVIDLFDKWQPIAREFTKYVLRGDADDPLDATLNWDAEGGGEAIIRPLVMDSFTGNVSGYSVKPQAEGQFDLIPETSGDYQEAEANQQAYLIFGYADPYVGDIAPYDYVQEYVNDEIGVRRPFWLRHQMETDGTMGIASRERGPLMIEPGFQFDIDANIHTTGEESGLWPLGIEVIRADHTDFGGVMD